jgi:cytochrome c553
MSAPAGLRWRAIGLLAASAGVLSPLVFAAEAAPATSGFVVPAWAYPGNPPAERAAAAAKDDGSPLHVPGSQASYTRAQATDLFAAPDWHPDDHPPMPGVVAHGRKPSVHACAYCHLPDGSGRPENAPVAGLPAEYIVRQVRDMARGARRSAWDGPYPPSDLMRKVAENASEAEIADAAAYFSALRLKRRTEVVEAERVPATHAERWIYVRTEGAGDEPARRAHHRACAITGATSCVIRGTGPSPTSRPAALRGGGRSSRRGRAVSRCPAAAATVRIFAASD